MAKISLNIKNLFKILRKTFSRKMTTYSPLCMDRLLCVALTLIHRNTTQTQLT